MTNRRRVLFLISELDQGGAQRVFLTLLQHLDRTVFEPHLALFEKQGGLLRELPPDVVVHDLHTPRARYAGPPLIRCIRRLRPSAVLATLPAVNLTLLACGPFLPRGTRVLVRPSVLSQGLAFEWSRPRLSEWLSRRLYRRAHRVICLSDAMCQDVQQRYRVRVERLVRIYNPIDRKRVRELAATGGSPFPRPGPNLVAAGRLTRQKGFDVLLRAMAIVHKQQPTITLTILGEGELREQLTAQRDELQLGETVMLAGHQENPWRYFMHANVFVLSSRYEGLPNAVLEALTLGTPVIATEAMGAIQEIRAHSDRVSIVPAENPEELADKILEACRRPKPEWSEQALTGFDLEDCMRAYEALLAE